MNIVDELSYYCNQDNPVGAFLLTGEWGCGKTYLIEKTLRNKLKETHIIIRVSLFGIASIEELHKVVKMGWIAQIGGIETGKKKLNSIFKFLDRFKEAAPEGPWKGLAGGLLAIDFMSFVKVKNTFGNKKVVLVFDDLERSRLNSIEILGVINEYCENQRFNVIIVADEERLKTEEQNRDGTKGLFFQDFKEKVVQRTLHFDPDYKQIIDNVIQEIKGIDYKEFLESNKNALATLISGTTKSGENLDKESEKSIGHSFRRNDEQAKDEEKARRIIKSRPHNIRSLKAALQDFHRIFTILQEYHVGDRCQWLLSFVSFSMAARSNLINKDEKYGYLFTNKDMDLLYPGYYFPQYFPEPLAKWVMEGRWEEQELKEYIELHYPTEKDTPASLVRSTRIDWLDESVVWDGMNAVAQEAYHGKLTYNQYVLFIINNKIAREYGLKLPAVEWDKVQGALKDKIEADIRSENDTWDDNYHEIIGEKQLKDYTEEEQNAYRLIVNIRDNYAIVLEKNRRSFISEIKDSPEAALSVMQNKRYKCFDQEMAAATLEGYKNATNPVKARFPESFIAAWRRYKHSFDVEQGDIEVTISAFRWLEDELKKLLEEYLDKPFKHKFTEVFIEKVHYLNQDETEEDKS